MKFHMLGSRFLWNLPKPCQKVESKRNSLRILWEKDWNCNESVSNKKKTFLLFFFFFVQLQPRRRWEKSRSQIDQSNRNRFVPFEWKRPVEVFYFVTRATLLTCLLCGTFPIFFSFSLPSVPFIFFWNSSVPDGTRLNIHVTSTGDFWQKSPAGCLAGKVSKELSAICRQIPNFLFEYFNKKLLGLCRQLALRLTYWLSFAVFNMWVTKAVNQSKPIRAFPVHIGQTSPTQFPFWYS